MFTEPGLKALLNELHTVRASWYLIGLQLEIPHTTLDCLKQNHSDPSDLMWEVLKYWLDTAVDPRPSWEAVVAALTSCAVSEKNVAAHLVSKYCLPVQHIGKFTTCLQPTTFPFLSSFHFIAQAKCTGSHSEQIYYPLDDNLAMFSASETRFIAQTAFSARKGLLQSESSIF